MSLGFIGLGDMGMPMARRLLSMGAQVIAWNRSAEKLNSLAAEGAIAAASPAEVMARADIVGLCLGSHQAVEEVAWGPRGLFSSTSPGARFIADFSTGSPESTMSFARRAAERHVTWVDTPFSGGAAAAAAGKLIVFAGGDVHAIAALQPLLSPLAVRVSRMGSVGMGQVTKLCNNAISGCVLLLIAETIALARKADIDVTHFAEALKGGVADSPHLQIFGQRMAEHRFEPRLGAIGLIERDVNLASELAAARGAHTPILSLVRQLYAAARQEPSIDMTADVSRLIGLFESVAQDGRS